MSVEETGGAHNPQQGGGLEAIGERLASARLERKLELGAVASQMHLSREVVAALEAGDASALPAMTFVRGYIKTYARLLGLDEKEIFALLPVAEGFRPAPLKAVGMRGPRRRQPLGKWLLWPIAAFLAFAVIAYGVPLMERLWNKATRTQQDEESPNVLQLPLGDEQGDEEQPVPEQDQGVEPLPEETAPQESAVTPESEFETGGEVGPRPPRRRWRRARQAGGCTGCRNLRSRHDHLAFQPGQLGGNGKPRPQAGGRHPECG